MKKLTEKEKKFIQAYTDKESDTFGNRTRSYSKVYSPKNDNVAAVMGSRMLRKVKVLEIMEELNKEFKVDISKHVKTLDRKLTALAEQGKISREELAGYRLLGEFAGTIGNKGVNVNLDMRNGACPHCGRSEVTFDITSLKTIPCRPPEPKTQIPFVDEIKKQDHK